MNPETFTVRRFIKDQMLSNNLKTQTILTEKPLISSIKTLHKKWIFPLRISSVNAGFGHIYWRNP